MNYAHIHFDGFLQVSWRCCHNFSLRCFFI